MRLPLILICIFTYSHLLSQVVYKDIGNKSDSASIHKMFSKALLVLDSTKIKGFQTDRMDIVEINEVKYLIPNGLFDVYIWKDETWRNMYKGPFQGFNFGAKIFVHKGEIYAFGGYGYWRNHGMLVKFLRERGEWDLLPFTSDLPFYYAYQIPEGLHLFNNIKSIDLDIDNLRIRESSDPIVDKIVMPKPTHLNSFEFDHYYYLIEHWETRERCPNERCDVFFQNKGKA